MLLLGVVAVLVATELKESWRWSPRIQGREAKSEEDVNGAIMAVAVVDVDVDVDVDIDDDEHVEEEDAPNIATEGRRHVVDMEPATPRRNSMVADIMVGYGQTASLTGTITSRDCSVGRLPIIMVDADSSNYFPLASAGVALVRSEGGGYYRCV